MHLAPCLQVHWEQVRSRDKPEPTENRVPCHDAVRNVRLWLLADLLEDAALRPLLYGNQTSMSAGVCVCL